jgi:hypothetical protein
MYKFYINQETGVANEATEEQIEREGAQILVIKGVEALLPPRVWPGEYKGELLFYPMLFENITGSGELNIQVGKSIVQEIVNTEYGVYVAKIMDESGQVLVIDDKHYNVLFRDLAGKKE